MTVGTLGLPEFGAEYVRNALMHHKPKNFSDLVKVCEITHGTKISQANSCKIGSSFPKAHAISFVIIALKLGWYKIHYPKAFYEIYCDIYFEKDTLSHFENEIKDVEEYLKKIKSENGENSEAYSEKCEEVLIIREAIARRKIIKW